MTIRITPVTRADTPERVEAGPQVTRPVDAIREALGITGELITGMQTGIRPPATPQELVVFGVRDALLWVAGGDHSPLLGLPPAPSPSQFPDGPALAAELGHALRPQDDPREAAHARGVAEGIRWATGHTDALPWPT